MKKSLLILFCLFLGKTFATHNRAGEITYRWISGTTYEATITTYTKESVAADRCDLELFWGDGKSSILPRVNGSPTNPNPNAGPCLNGYYGESLGNDVQRNIYKGTHSYETSGVYILSFEDPNRNAGIANIIQSVQVVFYVQSELVISPSLGGNSSPVLLNPPIDNGCINQIYKHNLGAFDSIDGDSLAYRLVPCRKAGGVVINTTYDPTYVQDSVKIDSKTGDLVWDLPRNIGQYNFAIEVSEFRKKSNGQYVRIGYVIRDLQIDILNCGNEPPVIDPVGPFCIEAGQTLNFDVTANDPDLTFLDSAGRILPSNASPSKIRDTAYDGVVLSAFGGPFVVKNPATFPEVFGKQTVTGTFNWNTKCLHVRQQPYQVTFEARDIPVDKNETPLVDIYTTEITVVAPSPKNPTATGSEGRITLNWDPSICTEAVGYRIYRRKDSYGFIPAPCETGVPAYTGYVFIGENEGLTNTTFIDSVDLIKGIRYCYMVIAYFEDEAESYASEEFCASLPLTAPFITNVDITSTSTTSGEIDVKWIAPPVLDTLFYPPPYFYKLFRATGQNGIDFIELQSFNGLDDTAFTDMGLNTQDTSYIYRVDLFSGNSAELAGSSPPASSVFLEIAPMDEGNRLNFTHNTPWENFQYLVYRDTVGDRLNFHLLDTAYADVYRDTGLVNGKNYCYYAEAFGRYTANDGSIPEPLRNRSQENCAVPTDTNAPCAPIVDYTYICASDSLLLTWDKPDGIDCRDDVVKYYLYYKETNASEFPSEPFDSVNGGTTSYLRFGKGINPPVAGCYAITAIDDANLDPAGGDANESNFSKVICLEPCPSIILPNFFSPNGDGIEEYFTLAGYASRDIKEIRIKIFNRWGTEVFATNNIETFRQTGWDGTDQRTGQPCVEGVYYYIAFYTPLSLEIIREEKLEGFVHLFR